ncbi:hypothetical protein [Bradyrhizobium sp. CCBAU 51627]|uniref:hypothetical protein n=1 Tax=Bradyrhizobium sp. CCBAU 51627 TaxID=1325088 RepID=UPI002305A5A0|nr:hypothetical protein [Bradyrhizobium sp. CCBAU 51627]MDA9430969.1 hypothetical protein [Bradyrhizobium sp. CCBAU 51627]
MRRTARFTVIACTNASLACAAIDQGAPDALDFEIPLKLDDVVFGRVGGSDFEEMFARRDPAF